MIMNKIHNYTSICTHIHLLPIVALKPAPENQFLNFYPNSEIFDQVIFTAFEMLAAKKHENHGNIIYLDWR